MFTNLHQLKSLSLISNLISFIEPFVFDESANLSSLSSIDLSHNRMTELEPWPLKRAQHRPMNVALQCNSITNFTNALQWTYSCNFTKIFESTLNLSINDIKHIMDIFSGWSVIDGRLLILLLLLVLVLILVLILILTLILILAHVLILILINY